MRIIDTLIVFRILKLLVTPWNKQKAYQLGFIDNKGKRITHNEDGTRNLPNTKIEKSSLTMLHRLVFNLKRIINKVPFGKSQFASYAVALALLKEHCELSDDQAEELYEKFYRYLKESDNFNPELITETLDLPNLHKGTYRLRFNNEQDETLYKPKTAVEIKGEVTKVYGISVYEGFVGTNRVFVSAEDVY